MAHELKQPIDVVATSGPGLMFIAYPEAISRMPIPHLWAILFFVMLIAVGLDTQFGMFETVSSGIVDAFPEKLAHRKTWVVAALAGAMFVISLPFTTNAGIYIYNLIDWYASTIAVTLGGALECLAVGWYYGAERFSEDLELMLGYRAPVILRLCWCVVSPLILLTVMVIMLVKYERVTYEGAAYPELAVTLGVLCGMVTVVAIPIVCVVEIIRTPGTITQRLHTLMKPQNWRPNERKYWEMYDTKPRPRVDGILDYVTLNLLGRRGRSIPQQ